MTKEELKKWFWNKYNSCYYVKHTDYPESIFMYYDKKFDKNFDRQKKLSRVLYKDTITIIYPSKVEGICLFELDYKNSSFVCDFKYIWKVFQENISDSDSDIELFINTLLVKHTKLDGLSPKLWFLSMPHSMEEHTKLEIYK